MKVGVELRAGFGAGEASGWLGCAKPGVANSAIIAAEKISIGLWTMACPFMFGAAVLLQCNPLEPG